MKLQIYISWTISKIEEIEKKMFFGKMKNIYTVWSSSYEATPNKGHPTYLATPNKCHPTYLATPNKGHPTYLVR